MSNNKQSSVEWLQAIELERDLTLADWNKAKAMHKEEHRKTWDECLLSSNPEKTFEDHYNETFSDESNT